MRIKGKVRAWRGKRGREGGNGRKIDVMRLVVGASSKRAHTKVKEDKWNEDHDVDSKKR